MSEEREGDPSGNTSSDGSELQRFARCFTADWKSRSDSLYMLVQRYLEGLPFGRKKILERQFYAFLFGDDSSDEALLQLWYGLGAEAWDADLAGIRPIMFDFYWMMNPDAPEFAKIDFPADSSGHGRIVVGVKPRGRE